MAMKPLGTMYFMSSRGALTCASVWFACVGAVARCFVASLGILAWA